MWGVKSESARERFWRSFEVRGKGGGEGEGDEVFGEVMEVGGGVDCCIILQR